jgi:hypothetical protein
MIWIVGHEQNPRKERGVALSPDDPGSAGQRLFEMSGLSAFTYLNAFVRVNVEDRPLIPSGARVIVLGREAWNLLGLILMKVNWFETVDLPVSRMRLTLIPHPSGLCRLYNDPANRERVRKLFEEVLSEGLYGIEAQLRPHVAEAQGE